MVEETASDARAPAFDQLFAGSMTEVKNRWAASAVQDSAGEWHLVLSADHVQGDASSRRVKLFSGGSFGRGFFRSAEWFKANAG